jgi:hypothetical protein
LIVVPGSFTLKPVINDLPPSSHDLRHLDPEVRKERVKLAANGINAVGLALFIGALVAPVVDATRSFDGSRIGLGILLGIACVVAAQFLLRYMKAKESL